jgi:hypothetical protein
MMIVIVDQMLMILLVMLEKHVLPVQHVSVVLVILVAGQI